MLCLFLVLFFFIFLRLYTFKQHLNINMVEYVLTQLVNLFKPKKDTQIGGTHEKIKEMSKKLVDSFKQKKDTQIGGTPEEIKEISEKLVDLRETLKELNQEAEPVKKEQAELNEACKINPQTDPTYRLRNSKNAEVSKINRRISPIVQEIIHLTNDLHNLQHPEKFHIHYEPVDYTKPYDTHIFAGKRILYEHEKELERLTDKENLHDTLMVELNDLFEKMIKENEHLTMDHDHLKGNIHPRMYKMEEEIKKLIHEHKTMRELMKMKRDKRIQKLSV